MQYPPGMNVKIQPRAECQRGLAHLRQFAPVTQGQKSISERFQAAGMLKDDALLARFDQFRRAVLRGCSRMMPCLPDSISSAAPFCRVVMTGQPQARASGTTRE